MYKNLSFYDLLQLPDFKLACKLDDKSAMERILWNLGIDTTQLYEIVSRNHRPLSSNIAWEGLRVEGVARSDHEWITGKYATLEEIAYASKDAFLKDELLSLDPHSFNADRRQYDEDYFVDETLPEIEEIVNVIDEVGDCYS